MFGILISNLQVQPLPATHVLRRGEERVVAIWGHRQASDHSCNAWCHGQILLWWAQETSCTLIMPSWSRSMLLKSPNRLHTSLEKWANTTLKHGRKLSVSGVCVKRMGEHSNLGGADVDIIDRLAVAVGKHFPSSKTGQSSRTGMQLRRSKACTGCRHQNRPCGRSVAWPRP